MEKTLTLMTYNVLHFENIRTGEIDYDAFARAVRDADADVVGLNEVYGPGSEFGDQAGELARRLGYDHYFAEAFLDDGINPFGNALISRFPIENARTVPVPYPEVRTGDQYYEPRAVLVSDVAGYRILSTHFGLNTDEQENALKTVLPLLRDTRCVLMGDFNVEPDDAILRPVREKMRDADVFLPPGTASFPSDEPRVKIDYIFLSRDAAVCDAAVLPIVVSDHRPIRVILRAAGRSDA